MDRLWIYYYAFLLILIILSCGYYLFWDVAQSAKLREHHIGVNLTKSNSTCILTWLGGWDFDSFYENISVNGVNKGHPFANSVIYKDSCERDIVVRMYDRAVRSEVELYRYNATEGR